MKSKKKISITYENLIACSELDPMLNSVASVPTTFFVDKEGNLIDYPVVGADIAEYKTHVNKYLDSLE